MFYFGLFFGMGYYSWASFFIFILAAAAVVVVVAEVLSKLAAHKTSFAFVCASLPAAAAASIVVVAAAAGCGGLFVLVKSGDKLAVLEMPPSNSNNNHSSNTATMVKPNQLQQQHDSNTFNQLTIICVYQIYYIIDCSIEHQFVVLCLLSACQPSNIAKHRVYCAGYRMTSCNLWHWRTLTVCLHLRCGKLKLHS